MKEIVEVRYIKNGEPSGRCYNYFTDIPLSVGDKVICPTRQGESKAVVTAVDVPESKINDRIMPLLKTITERAADTEADHE